ncbi:PEP-CTERM sorting domain-containing protein [Pseudomonadota bacterium]
MKNSILALISILFACQAQAAIVTGEIRGVVYNSYSEVGGADIYNGQELIANFRYDTDAAQLYDYYAGVDHTAEWKDTNADDSWVDISYTIGSTLFDVVLDPLHKILDKVKVVNDDANGADMFMVNEQDIFETNRHDYAYFYFYDYVNDLVNSTDVVQQLAWEDLNTTDGGCASSNASDSACGHFYAHDYLYNTDTKKMQSYHKVSAYLTSANINYGEVAEPASVFLLGLGLVGVGMMHRRKVFMPASV